MSNPFDQFDTANAFDQFDTANAPKPVSHTRGIVDAVGQGLTFGWSDELGAQLDTAIELGKAPGAQFFDDRYGETYDRNVADRRSKIDQYRAENPGKAFSAEMGGGVVAGIAAGGKLPIKEIPLVNNMSKSGQFATLGAASGATYGAGAAGSGVEESLTGAVLGALTGGVAGVSMPFISGVLKRTITKLTKPVWSVLQKEFAGAETQAKKQIIKALSRGNKTQQEIAQKLAENGKLGTLAEAGGDDAIGLLDDAYNHPGTTAQKSREVITARNEGMQARIIDAVKKVTGADGKYLDNYLDLDAQRKLQSKPLYDIAHAQEIPLTDELKAILKTPAGKAAWGQAQKRVANELDGKPLPKIFQIGEDGVEKLSDDVAPDVRAWDYIKQGFDDIINDNTDALGKMNSEAGMALKLKNALLEQVDNLSPEYAAARKAYAGPTANMAAMKQGTKILVDDAEISGHLLSKMGDSEKEAYIIGATKAVRDKIMSASESANAANKLLNSGLIKERLRPLFKTDGEYDEFIKVLRRESMFKKTENSLGGSQTAKRLFREQQANIPRSATEAITSELREIISPDLSEEVRNEIGRLLLSQGDEAAEILARMKMPKGTPAIPSLFGPSSGIIAGGQLGRVPGLFFDQN